MDAIHVLIDGFERVRQAAQGTLDGLTPQQLAARPGPEANSIGWLVWHLTRIQDDHVAGAAGTGQVWTTGGWADAFGLPFDAAATGYGQSSEEVAATRVPSAELLAHYLDAVHAATLEYLGGLTGDDLDRVVDRSWDPPVTLSVRLVSVISDDLQHAGQAAYVRGLLGA